MWLTCGELYVASTPKGVTMPAPANTLRRLRFGCLAALVCAALTTPPAAQAAADEQLAAAIAATQGSYLVYNFGPGYPAPRS